MIRLKFVRNRRENIMGKYTDYIMKTAQDLLSVPSPSGFTHMAADFVKKEF